MAKIKNLQLNRETGLVSFDIKQDIGYVGQKQSWSEMVLSESPETYYSAIHILIERFQKRKYVPVMSLSNTCALLFHKTCQDFIKEHDLPTNILLGAFNEAWLKEGEYVLAIKGFGGVSYPTRYVVKMNAGSRRGQLEMSNTKKGAMVMDWATAVVWVWGLNDGTQWEIQEV